MKKLNHLAVYNTTTGEVQEDVVVAIVGNTPTKIKMDKGYAKVFVAFLEDLLTDREVAGKSITLLLYIINKLDWNNLEVYLFYKEVCTDLEIDKVTYYKWLSKLIEKGYLQLTEKKYIYRLKTYSFIKGSMQETLKEEKEKEEKKKKKIKDKD